MQIQKEEVKLTKEEFEAQQAEVRRSQAEAAYVILLDDNKRVQTKIEEGNKTIESQKETIAKNVEEISKSNSLASESKKSASQELQRLNEINTEIEKAEKLYEDFKTSSEFEKKKIFDDHVDFTKKLNVTKAEKQSELSDLENEKIALTEDVKKLQEKFDSLINNVTLVTQKISDLNDETEVAQKNKETALENLKNISVQVSEQESILAGKKKDIDLLVSDTATKKEDNDQIISDITKNKAVNDSEIAQHVALLSKQQILDNRTEFIKGKYEQAGIKWEE